MSPVFQIRDSNGHGLDLVEADTAEEALRIFRKWESDARDFNVACGAASFEYPLLPNTYAVPTDRRTAA